MSEKCTLPPPSVVPILLLANRVPMLARVLLKPLWTVYIRIPLFLRATTRRCRTLSMLLRGQNIKTLALGVLPKFLSVVPLALLEAVIRTITPLLGVVPRIDICTRRGKTRRVTLPKV